MSFRNKRTGAFQPFGGLFNTENTSTIYREAPDWVTNQAQQTMNMAIRPQMTMIRPRVAPLNADQQEFFSMARDYARDSMGRETPTIDVSPMQDQLGRTVDTSAITGLLGQRADASGVLGMLGQRADTSALDGVIGKRVDPRRLQAAAEKEVDLSELAALMDQQNVARDIFQEQTTREVTPYLETQINDVTDRALQNVNSLYARSGRLGSNAFADAAARGVTNASAPILQAQANADANRQLQAAGMLGQAFEADRAADIGLANSRAQFMGDNYGRLLQGEGLLANLQNQALSRDANIASQLAGYSESGLNRDMAANQYAAQLDNMGIARDAGLAQSAAQFAAGDANRDASLASQLTDASRQQAMLGPMQQQMDMANMGLLAQIGSQQQAQQQAQYNSQLQYQAMLNQAQQQQFNNMVMGTQLGEPYIGATTVGDQGMFNTLLGGASTALGLGIGAGWNPFSRV